MVSIVELALKPGMTPDAVQAVEETLAATRAFEGCDGADVLIAKDAPKILVYERWQSPEHEAAYLEWRAGPGATDVVAPFLAAAPSRYSYDEA